TASHRNPAADPAGLHHSQHLGTGRLLDRGHRKAFQCLGRYPQIRRGPVPVTESSDRQIEGRRSGLTSPVLFYRHDGEIDLSRLAALRAATPDHDAQIWRPGSGLAGPTGTRGASYAIYNLFHRLGVFANDD